MQRSFSTLLAGLALLAGAAAIAAAHAPAAAGQAPAPAPPAQGGAAAGGGAAGGRGGGGGGFANAYPQHAQADPAAIERGRQLFSTNCSFCHGPDARGSSGPNLLRSQLVMDDQNGEAIAVVVQNGRPELGMPKFGLTVEQISDIAAFIHSFRVAGYDASRDIPTDIVVGHAAAGEAYFNGTGKCNSCHSVTGDLAGIGSRLDPKALQNALVAGRAGRGGFGGPGAGAAAGPVTKVIVTLPGGKAYEGKLTHLDDFLVTLTTADDQRMSFARNGDIPRVEVRNPLQAHLDLLGKYSDDDIHNLTAYLVTLK